MKQQIPKPSSGLLLEPPNLIDSEPSFVMQFFFYFSLLLLGFYGTYGCFYTAFSVPLSLPVIIPCGILFSAVFTIVYLTKLDRIMLLILTLTFAFLTGIFFLRYRILDGFMNRFIRGFVLTFNTVSSAYEENSEYYFLTLPSTTESINEMTVSSTIFAVFILFFIMLFMAWLLIRRKNTFLCFLLTVPFLAVSVIFNIIPHFPAVAALSIFWAFLLLNGSFLRSKNKFNRKKNIFYGSGKIAAHPQSFILLPILVACLMLVNVLFPMQNFRRLDFTENLRSSFLSHPSILSPLQVPIQSDTGNTDHINLQLVGNLAFTGGTVLRVYSSKQEADYLKGFTGSIYTGQSWDALPEEEYEKLDTILNGWKVQNFPSLFSLLPGNLTNGELHTYDLTIQNMEGNSHSVYVPYGLVSTPDELSGMDFINDSSLRAGNGLPGINEYSMKSISLQTDIWAMEQPPMDSLSPEQSSFAQAAKAYTDFVYSHYTQIPEPLEEKLDQYRYKYNLDTEHYSLPHTLAAAIIDQIQSENTYSLSPGTTPAGQDFVDYFLFENHKGYCMHFASAAVVLLRSAGVPARYVQGYAVSASDFESQDGWADILDSRMHAWAEIYLSGIGWVPVESTPGAQNGIIDYRYSDPEIPPAISSPEEEAATDTPEDTSSRPVMEVPSEVENSESRSPEPENETTGLVLAALLRILSISALPGLLAAALLSGRKFRIALRNKQFAQQDKNKAAIAIYEYIVKLYTYTNPKEADSFKISDDLYELVLKARFSHHFLTEQEVGILLAYAKRQVSGFQARASLFQRFIGKYFYFLF